jgi:hypothetical protein
MVSDPPAKPTRPNRSKHTSPTSHPSPPAKSPESRPAKVPVASSRASAADLPQSNPVKVSQSTYTHPCDGRFFDARHYLRACCADRGSARYRGEADTASAGKRRQTSRSAFTVCENLQTRWRRLLLRLFALNSGNYSLGHHASRTKKAVSRLSGRPPKKKRTRRMKHTPADHRANVRSREASRSAPVLWSLSFGQYSISPTSAHCQPNHPTNLLARVAGEVTRL